MLSESAVTLLIAAALIVAALWWGRRAFAVDIFRSESADDFVYVEEDGAVRDLTMDERAYINTPFAGDDSGRPYIKTWYWSRTPDGKRSGFISRSMVPGHVRIRKNDG